MSLGPPLLFTEAGEQVRFRTRKHFALLIRLAVEAGRKLTRDYLMDLLWPDVAAPRARHSLAQALTVLKEKIGRDQLVVQRASIAPAAGAVQAGVGDRTNARKVFARFGARLGEELDAKPSAELVRIAELLREGRRAAPRPTVAGQVSERRERRFEAETLIGREREFARLYDAWLEVRRREPRIAVLLGDPGVGKTTLTN